MCEPQRVGVEGMQEKLLVMETSDTSRMPTAAEVEGLYAVASCVAPLNESPQVAKVFANLYAHSRDLPGAIAITARRGNELVGFAYGHTWRWDTSTDSWSDLLSDRLGAAASRLEGSLVVELVAVAPQETRSGLGRQLLQTLLSASDHATSWLVTTDLDAPARRLYERSGWAALGHGPDAPNGEPGLVMIHHRS